MVTTATANMLILYYYYYCCYYNYYYYYYCCYYNYYYYYHYTLSHSQVPESMTGFMSNVALPTELSSTAQLRALEQRLLLEHHVSIKGESIRRTGTVESIFFVRLSAQVYLELSDFANMADLVLQLLPEILTTTTTATITEN